MSTGLLTQVHVYRGTKNVFELFLGLYQLVAESGMSEVARRVCSHTSSRYDSWHHHDHPIARSLANVIDDNPNPWIEEFPARRDKLLSELHRGKEIIATETATSSEVQEQEVLCIVLALRQLDPIIEALLRFSGGQLSYPAPPQSDRYTVVRKPRTSFYSLYRAKEHLPAPPPLQHGEFAQALGLISTYVVPRLVGGQYFEWSVNRVPESIESVWRSHAQTEISFTLLSFPHGPLELGLEILNDKFLVHNLGPNESQIQEQVLEQVAKIVDDGASVLLFPELTGSDALRDRVRPLLIGRPNRIGMVVPGSQHQMSNGIWRNRCTAIDTLGRDCAIVHDKFTRYALPQAAARAQQQTVSSDECLEGIEVTPRRICLYDSHSLGRFVILICRDIIEPQTAEFLRLHSLDHIFVISMSPSLNDFQTTCSQLGKILDCGVYVVNTAFGDKPQPAFLYQPIRRKQVIETCPNESHDVCQHVVQVRLPRHGV